MICGIELQCGISFEVLIIFGTSSMKIMNVENLVDDNRSIVQIANFISLTVLFILLFYTSYYVFPLLFIVHITVLYIELCCTSYFCQAHSAQFPAGLS